MYSHIQFSLNLVSLYATVKLLLLIYLFSFLTEMANYTSSDRGFEFVFDSDPDKLFEEFLRVKLENK